VAISVVGGVAASEINGGNVTLTLTGLGAAQNDVVLVFGGIGGTAAGTQGASGSVSGAYQQLVSADSGANQFYVGWQRMGATPDATITCNGNGDAGDSAAYACIILRGVTTASPPTDVATTSTNGSSTNPNPPSIDWSTSGTAVIVGALSVVNDASITIPSGYSSANLTSFSASGNDGEDASVAIAYDLTPADPEDPPSFTTWSTGVWQAATVALKEGITASFGDGALSGGSISGTATFVSAATDAKAVSMTGTGTASLAGASTAVATLFANGGCDNDELLLNNGTDFVLLNDGSSLLQINTGSPAFVGTAVKDTVLSVTGTVTASFVGDFDAAANNQDGALSVTATGAVPRNCRLLLNDGLSFILLNSGTDFLAKNEAACEVFIGASQADSVLSATGTITPAFEGLEIQSAAPFSMTGTGTAAFVGASTADGAFSATGTWTATFASAVTADSSLSATGTGIATLIGAATADSILGAAGTATVSFAYANEGEGALSSSGTGVADFVGASDSDAVLSADGSATTLFVSPADNFQDGALDASGTATATFVGADATPAEQPVVASPGGVAAPGAWRLKKKKKKKDELDDLIAQLKEQVVPWREAQDRERVGAQIALLADLNRAEALTLDNTLAQIESEIANLRELIAVMEDDEDILMMM
jgi:uncharacterized lipoprotein NlpE involved in copper resistance